MSTSSSIAILNLDGTVDSSYCNSDGYLSGNGQKLYLYYRNLDKVRHLISLGDMSSLSDEISPPHGVEHNFDNRHKGVCIFYGRDRGEEGVDTKTYESLEHYLQEGGYEYDYIYQEKKNEWYVVNQNTKKLQKLSSILLKQSAIPDTTKQMIKSEKQAKKLERDLKNKDQPAGLKYKL